MAASEDFVNFPSDSAQLYASVDWDLSGLGPYAAWPESLKQSILNILRSPLPMYICWGPGRLFLYNSAYAPLLSRRHPLALGQQFDRVWPELWPELRGLFDSVYKGENFYFQNHPLVLERHGYSEETFFTFSFSPLLDGEGMVCGLHCICYETTEKVNYDRAIHKLQEESSAARVKAETATLELQNFFRQAPVAIAIMEGPWHLIRSINTLYESIVGKRDLVGRSAQEAFGEGQGPSMLSMLDEAYRAQKTLCSKETRISLTAENGAGREAFLDVTYAPRYSAENVLEGISVTVVDVSTQVEARRSLEESEQKLNQLANSMPQMVWTARPDGEVEYCNERWIAFTGLSAKDCSHWGWLLAIHPLDVSANKEAWERSIAEGSDFVSLVRIRKLSGGEYKWFRMQFVSIRSVKGIMEKWCVSSTDIDDLHKLTNRLTHAQETLDAERRKFEVIFENAASAMALVREPSHTFEKANPSFWALMGRRPGIGCSFLEVFPEFREKNIVRMLDAVYQTGNTYKSIEEAIDIQSAETSEFETKYVDICFIQLKNSLGVVEGVLIDLVNVTDRVLARRKLEESEEWLQIATKAAKIGIWDLDTRQRKLHLSERAAAIFGFDAVKTIDLDQALSRVPDEDRGKVESAAALATAAEGSGVYDVIHRLKTDDGSMSWVSVFGIARRDPLNPERYSRLTGAIIDISQSVNSHNELMSARQSADEANSAKSAFLANMSHEIRSPLGAIMGFVELLKDTQLTKDDSLAYLGVIERNSQQLLRIIDDILDLSKVEAGKMLIENIRFSPLEILADFASLMGFRARENGIDFLLVAETELPDPIITDPTRLRQILTNVVGNAIKFTHKGRVELRVSYQRPYLRFQVKDTGVGISEEESGRLFQAFGQADVSTTRKFGGTGLGLVLTKKLSQALGGDFRLLQSKIGLGSIFMAEIKVEVPADSHLIQGSRFRFTTEPATKALNDKTLLAEVRVLVVEDSPDNQILLRVLLTRCGAQVEIASDGLEGVDKALEGSFDVVLMDVQMPRMDGYDAVRTLRRQHFEKPIIALTAHAMKEEREKCLHAGYSEFLSKPIDRNKLIEVIRDQLRL